MKLKTQSFLLILVLISFACNKDTMDENTEMEVPTGTFIDINDPDFNFPNSSDGQFLSFKTGEYDFYWLDTATQTSNSGTSIESSIESSMGTIIPDDSPENIYFTFVVNATKGTSLIFLDPTFESITFSFHQKWVESETTTNIDGCQMLPEGEFDNLFMPGNWNPLERVCLDEIENKEVSMSISATVNDKFIFGTSAINSTCDETPFDQTDSSFEIIAFEKVDNQIMIEGLFNLKIYSEDEVFNFENGQFRFL